MPKQEPLRSCLGCRSVRNKKEMLRFVLSPDRELVPDILAKLPGRGAYTCRCQICVRNAMQRKQFVRAFKGEVNCGTADDVIAAIARMMEERIASYLALANKAGKVVSGSDMVLDALRKKEAGAVVIACDISPDIGEKISHAASRAGIDQVRILDKERMGALLGKELRSAAAIEKGGFAETIIREIANNRNFFEGGAQER